ncbi:hypothetical protein HanRHA438_Chr15g0690401 [Helianthus annuus]|uniref:Uncharacterized protein n=1 Tax=Helianthus annuus TaxID=4232 RepID=A0A9K3H105_HELAN|nr:hypothetical protein HanXRQr2_Chr15g0678001 [Helianthus annuus]KAJ0829985.1 hypothetical protein HanPSC8_Chr15g0650031 [Helianthus annuus]KAJ0843348.1 hypothetical protein HanRHA438_Chr15g0690401 [Helianthus annuus]
MQTSSLKSEHLNVNFKGTVTQLFHRLCRLCCAFVFVSAPTKPMSMYFIKLHIPGFGFFSILHCPNLMWSRHCISKRKKKVFIPLLYFWWHWLRFFFGLIFIFVDAYMDGCGSIRFGSTRLGSRPKLTTFLCRTTRHSRYENEDNAR